MTSDEQSIDQVLKPHPHGVVLAVLVVPGASRSEVVGLHGAFLRVRIAAPAEAGRANKALTNVLSAAFDCRVDLLSGAMARRKRVLLRDLSYGDATARIASI